MPMAHVCHSVSHAARERCHALLTLTARVSFCKQDRGILATPSSLLGDPAPARSVGGWHDVGGGGNGSLGKPEVPRGGSIGGLRPRRTRSRVRGKRTARARRSGTPSPIRRGR